MKHYRTFLLAGTIGFAVDVSLLLLLIEVFGADPFAARAVSMSAAVFCGWLINRRLTFAPSGRPVVKEGARYGMVALGSAGINYAVYSALLLVFPEIPPVAALSVASFTATIFSYLGYLRLVFGGKREAPGAGPTIQDEPNGAGS